MALSYNEDGEVIRIPTGEFSVYQWFMDGQYEAVDRFVDAKTATSRAAQLAASVGGRIGTTTRIIITDGGDDIAWEWLHGKGVVFPLDVTSKKEA